MSEFELHESEPQAAAATIDLVSLRPNADTAVDELRRTIAWELAGVIGEVPDAELRMGMFSDEDGMVHVDLSAAAGTSTAAVVAELSAVLAPVAETAPASDGVRPRLVEWPVVADGRHGRLGFASEPGADAGLPWHAECDRSTHVVEELANLPREGLVVWLRAATHGPRPTWEVRLGALTTGREPSLRMRAAIRRRYAGLAVDGARGAASVSLLVAGEDLAQVFPIPVAGATPMRGMYRGSAAPIPLAPTAGAAVGESTGLRIGYAVTGGGRKVPVALSDHERLRHVHVLGQTGTGKSSALAGLVREMATGGHGGIVADPHGQLCDRVLAELPEETRDRVWAIRCGDIDNPVPMNPLAEADPVRRDIAIAEVCDTFQYLFDQKETGIVGPRFQERVAMTLRALAAVHGTRASLLDVPFAATDDAFMESAVASSGDERLKAWWRTNKLERNSNEHGQVLAWVNSKFAAFSNTVAMRGILGSGADAIDFAEAMDEGRIILLDLSKSALGEPASRLLGFLYLQEVWRGALRRTRPERPFLVAVDEAHTLISGALKNLLAEGRKFGLSVVLAHQFLEQLDADLRPAVDGNAATTIAFRCAVGDAATLHHRFGGFVESSTLVTMPDLTAICLRAAAPGGAYPHTLVIDHNTRVATRQGADLDLHVAEVMAASHAALVDPHRDVTAAAVNGASNVTTRAAPSRLRPPRRRVPPAPGPRRPDTATAAGPSFLVDWLAARTTTGDVSAAGASEPSDVSEATSP